MINMYITGLQVVQLLRDLWIDTIKVKVLYVCGHIDSDGKCFQSGCVSADP